MEYNRQREGKPLASSSLPSMGLPSVAAAYKKNNTPHEYGIFEGCAILTGVVVLIAP